MSLNLLELAKGHLSDAVISKIASSVGLDPNTAQGIIGKVFPALMAAFTDKAETVDGAAQVFDSIQDADDGILSNLTEAFTGDNSEIIEKGSGVLTSLLGGKLGSLTDVLGAIPGLSAGKIGGLLGLLTPVLTGMLKKQVVGSGLNAAGLASLLGDQKEHMSSSLGGDLLGKLGFASLGGVSDKVAEVATGAAAAVSGAAQSVSDATGSAVAGAADAIGSGVKSVGDTASNAVGGAASVVGGAAKSVGDTAGNAVSSAANIAGGAAAAATETTKQAGNGLLKIIPFLILGLLAFLGLKMCKKGDLTEGVTDTLGKATDAVTDTAGSVVDGATDVAGSVGDKIVDGASAVAETTGNAVGTVVDGAVDVGSNIAEATGNTVDTVVDGAADAAGAMGDKIADGASVVAETTGNAVGTVVDGATNVGDAVVETADGAMDKATEVIQSFVPVAEEGATAIQLSEKATTLARTLTKVTVTDEMQLEAIYTKLGNDTNSQFLYRIPFATGETGVPSSHQASLIAKLKEADPSATIVTIGYADVRGDDALNNKLSYGRAKEVGAWIKTTLGSDTNIETFSMGETDRFSKTEFSKNRAVEVWQMK